MVLYQPLYVLVWFICEPLSCAVLKGTGMVLAESTCPTPVVNLKCHCSPPDGID